LSSAAARLVARVGDRYGVAPPKAVVAPAEAPARAATHARQMPADLYGGALNEHFASQDEEYKDETDSSGIFINGAMYTGVVTRAVNVASGHSRPRCDGRGVAAAAAMPYGGGGPSSQRPGGDGDDAAAAVEWTVSAVDQGFEAGQIVQVQLPAANDMSSEMTAAHIAWAGTRVMIAPPPVAATPGATVSFELAPPPPPPQPHVVATAAGETAEAEHAGQPRVRVEVPAARRLPPGTLLLARAHGRRCVLRLPQGATAGGALLCMPPWIDDDGGEAAAAASADGGGDCFSEHPVLVPNDATPGQQLVATAPDGSYVAFRVPGDLPLHRRIRLRLPRPRAQWLGVTARVVRVHDERGAELL